MGQTPSTSVLHNTVVTMEKEQIEIMHKVDKLNPFVRWLGAASGLLILVIAGLAIYQGLNQVQ